MEYEKYAQEILPYMKMLLKVTTFKEITDISQGEMAVLCYLSFYHNGAAAGELTEKFSVGTSRTAAVLNNLEKKRMVERKPDIADRRKVLVYVTETGRKIAQEKHAETIAHIADLLRAMGDEDAKQFIRIMAKIARILN